MLKRLRALEGCISIVVSDCVRDCDTLSTLALSSSLTLVGNTETFGLLAGRADTVCEPHAGRCFFVVEHCEIVWLFLVYLVDGRLVLLAVGVVFGGVLGFAEFVIDDKT